MGSVFVCGNRAFEILEAGQLPPDAQSDVEAGELIAEPGDGLGHIGAGKEGTAATVLEDVAELVGREP
jgi:hypothetical protein